MAVDSEKARKKQLMGEWKRQQQALFDEGLPASRELFQALFDYLDDVAQEKDCDHSLRVTREFLSKRGVGNTEVVIKWLNDNGGYCDCEVLYNVEELFE